MAIIRKLTAFILSAIIFNITISYSECQGQTAFKERIHFNMGVGWDNYDMKRGFIEPGISGNYYFTEFENTRIEAGKEYCAEILFDFSRNFSFGPGIIYSSGRRKIWERLQTFLDDYYSRLPEPLLYSVSLAAPYLKVRYRSVFDVLDYSFDANLYYGFASLDAQVRNRNVIPPDQLFRRVDFNSSGVGYSLSIGVSLIITEVFAINNNIGYRSLIAGNLEDSDGNVLPNYHLNFSGYFIRGGISIYPWR